MTFYNIEDIFEDIPDDPENVLMKIPEEICKELKLNEGDTINIVAQDGAIIITKHG